MSLWFAFKTDDSICPTWLIQVVQRQLRIVRNHIQQCSKTTCPACWRAWPSCLTCGDEEEHHDRRSLLGSMLGSKGAQGAFEDPMCAESCAGLLFREMADAIDKQSGCGVKSPRNMLRVAAKHTTTALGGSAQGMGSPGAAASMPGAATTIKSASQSTAMAENKIDTKGKGNAQGRSRRITHKGSAEAIGTGGCADLVVARFERGPDGELVAHGDLTAVDMERLVFFERMFFLLDHDAKGVVTLEEAKHFLSFTALDLEASERNEAVERADLSGDRELVRYEFVEMCADLLWDMALPQLQLAVDNFKDAQLMYVTRNLNRWRALSRQVDRRARFYLPATYVCTLILLFNLEFSDDYHQSLASRVRNEQKHKMFQGLGNWNITPGGVAWSLVLPLLCVMTVLALSSARRYAQRMRILDDPQSDETKRLERERREIGRGPTLRSGLTAEHSVELTPFSSELHGEGRRRSTMGARRASAGPIHSRSPSCIAAGPACTPI